MLLNRTYHATYPKVCNIRLLHGLDKVPAKILKLSSDIIAQSLIAVFNLSLGTGIYIDEWKHARVTPIFKSDNRRKCENYRPISILPIISKVFEKEIFRQVYSYLTENSLLSNYQSCRISS